MREIRCTCGQLLDSYEAICEKCFAPKPRIHVTEDMVTRAIDALVYTGYDDATQIKVIRRQANCREYVRKALEAALEC